jgi:DNA-directed RNA polymerase I and III subunit RPAC1
MHYGANKSTVYAKDFVYTPVMRQVKYFTSEASAIYPVNPNILIAKMRPGQKIKLRAHAFKGIGADHIKYSPVATASYRLMPTIQIEKPIIGNDARKFARCFPRGVIGLEKVTASMAKEKDSGYEGKEGEDYAVVEDAMKDPVTRECLRHEEFKGKVKLGRVQDHFIFHIESTGQYDSDELFVEAAKILKYKCLRAQKALNALNS